MAERMAKHQSGDRGDKNKTIAEQGHPCGGHMHEHDFHRRALLIIIRHIGDAIKPISQTQSGQPPKRRVPFRSQRHEAGRIGINGRDIFKRFQHVISHLNLAPRAGGGNGKRGQQYGCRAQRRQNTQIGHMDVPSLSAAWLAAAPKISTGT